jgi:iron-sulfur cluster assembly protein
MRRKPPSGLSGERPRLKTTLKKQQHQNTKQTQTAPPAAPAPAATAAAPITLTDAALSHLKKLRAEAGGGELLLRVGVKQGGCSGMSYVMDFEAPDKVGADDTVIAAGAGADAEGLKLVTDPKSLLYLFGMTLDFSSALIGGGFGFKNPNATETCGCGTSFNV